MSELKRLSGRVALVTGGSRGIGRAIALRLAREGARVAIDFVAHIREAEEVIAQLKDLGVQTACIQADVSNADSARTLVREAARALGKVDVVVNNAGVEKYAPFWDITEADYDKVLGVNLKGAFFIAQEFARQHIASKSAGKIINISSVHEVLPFPGFAPYCLAKGALGMLTRTLAIELAPFGITVNGVAPGAIETDINQSVLRDPELTSALLAKIPLRRMGKPDEVAGIVAFLASSEADYVTGSTYFVDGGLTWNYVEAHGKKAA